MKFVFLVFISLFLQSTGFTQKIKIQNPVHFLALGDSYTIGQSVAMDQNWPTQFATQLNKKGYNVESVKIIAQTGWRTDNLKSAINQQLPLTDFCLVSLLIGVNNQFQGGSIQIYANEFEELLQQAIFLAGNNPQHVFVLSIPDYAYTPYGKGSTAISVQIDQFNAVNKQIADKYNVVYVNITPISRNGLNQPELIATDGLHPSGIMYGFWVQEVIKSIENELGLPDESSHPGPVSFNLSQRKLAVQSSQKQSEIFIYNTNGSLVLTQPLQSNFPTTINLSRLAGGIYYLIFRCEGKLLYRTKIFLL